MSPKGLKTPGEAIKDLEEGLIRRGRRTGGQKYIIDQMTGMCRPPAAMFEPRLPQNRPDAKVTDKYISVNILSSLQAAGLSPDWGGNNESFYSVSLRAEICFNLGLTVTWEPVDSNPHHGGINGVAELYTVDRDGYEKTLTVLAKEASVLPECVPSDAEGA